MKNTFWTIFGDNYYRVKNGELLQAPVSIDNSVDVEHEINSASVPSNILEQINNEFCSSFSKK